MHLPVRRTRRRVLAILIGTVVLAALFVMLVPPDRRRPGPLPGGTMETMVHRRGWTGWLIVEERGDRFSRPPVTEHRFRLHPEGTVQAGVLAAAVILAGLAVGRGLDRALRLRRRCDRCGYDRRGLAEGRPCPECGERPAE